MINKEIFFNGFRQFYKNHTGKKTISQKTADAVGFLIDSFNADPKWKDIRHVAYAFATMSVETAWTYEPIKEYRGKTLTKQQQKYWNSGYYGRGYVQITWDFNYRKASQKLGVDFLSNPDLVMDRYYAFQIMSMGMHEGWFTGKKLSDYINAKTKDYRNARRIINGTDHAEMIAGYAEAFENMLNTAKMSAPIVAAPAAEPVQPVAEAPAPIESPAVQPAVQQPVANPIPLDQTTVIEVPEAAPVETTGWGTWISNVRAQVASLGIGGLSLGSLQFLQDPLFIKVAVGLVATAVVVSATVYIVTILLKNKDKREREQRAHELTLKQMEIAADPTKINVKVVKRDAV